MSDKPEPSRGAAPADPDEEMNLDEVQLEDYDPQNDKIDKLLRVSQSLMDALEKSLQANTGGQPLAKPVHAVDVKWTHFQVAPNQRVY
jgi:hypothetical protein